ncbi:MULTISPECIES: glutamine-hydrolyzing GMP synthase [unclassified Undibacterium]|uniref:glutamine-hydrolyzing GMP synthase n=1 Tax=unclassified Undibacterium TaxID=2630295 RepID=UPI002AC97729|nr:MULTISPECIES: glutamine-hydrolyzing GMP synthase [unclassified Undibacterium]MEB0139470.1 glutamine-hydrolyzing GMP synthase [Undibacterium sp. CCC2.1]MEB0171648.1 glutamine-hydrolyzing GMP synthase [Undibacterium sp. CCC1.1]MEB0176214.1 glutamine-hydrolyzing GMP synthase [Undibacterium sp. CCC3.4]MEB0214993.1 glutamine-hydrolyzing GMP synthase [Undibacterium sp. 5I2]WPX43225.1 glutamine-hydrolyzing GMP synthase [Undibacterium sp. CCC3.4]
MHSKILILDFGSQVTQLIARRVRDAGVFSEVHPYDVSDEFIRNYGAAGIILSGGPNSVTDGDTPRAPLAVFDAGVPVLGICYGMQTMAAQLGGKVENGTVREFGYAEVRARGHTALFDGIHDFVTAEGHGMLKVWMSHGDKVNDMPPGFKLMASTDNCPIAAMADEARRFYAVQFHPEVTHTLQGEAIIARFVHQICGCQSDWNMPDYIAEAVASIRAQVGSDEVILGLSGGVDSSVAAALIHRAIGDQLTCVFVDHGLLRLDEGKMVMEMFANNLGVKVIHVDATAQFMGHLAGVADPEAKRKIIGREFVEVFQVESAKLSKAKWLAQGTIYPDVIESAGKGKKGSHTIKSHHNVGGLPDTLKLQLLEPLRELFKDEVRKLGVALGLPHGMVYRHPFPGPGLGVRILGAVNKEFADLLRRADAIFIEELRNNFVDDKAAVPVSWYDATSQAFAVFLPVKSVGVMGDGRTYEYVVALRAVQTQDFMTAHWAHLPHELLGKVSNRIINEVRGINRVVYDISGKPPATIEWE